MDNSFEKGFEYFRKNFSGFIGAIEGTEFGQDRARYIDSIRKEIQKLEKDINSFLDSQTNSKMLKGDIAEFWHADTFNINAAKNLSTNRMNVDRSHDLGSVDVSGLDGNNYSMKYYSSGQESAKAQAISIFQRFKEYQAKGGKDDISKYLSDRNYNDIDSIINDPLYSGQFRIIPSDQLGDAINWLEKKINIEQIRRPEQVERYQETLKLLKDKITDNQGNESISLSKEEAEKLAKIAKEGKFDAEEYGIVAPDIINFEMLIKESMKAGLNAAIISMVLKVGPELYKTIDYLIKNGEIEEEQFRKIGFAALKGGSEGFIRGSVAASITICCKSGMLGESLKNVDPSIVSAVTVLAINVIKGSYEVVIGKSTRNKLANEIVRDMFISTCSLIGGKISQASINIPVIGYLIGSFVGSILGSFTYNACYNTALSFCIDTGFTMFGLVEQDYKLPEDIIEEIGINTFEYETFSYESFKPDTFEFESFEPDNIKPENIGIKYLSRGVLGITKIGYVE